MTSETDQEVKDALKIYKIAGPVIIIILLIGVLYAVLHKPAQPMPQPVIQPPVEKTPEPAIIPQNITPELNLTNVTITQNVTNQTQNVTQNITSNETQINITVTATPTPTPQIISYTWEGITINFPESMKRIQSNQKSHNYIEILEVDGTPVTNGEQFDLDFFITDSQGKDTEVVATFESNKWLISLLLTNKSNYTITVKLDCEAQKGHCQRLYPPGNTQNTTIVEVV